MCTQCAAPSVIPPRPTLSSQIALKHRKNKRGGQRIVSFVGSPVDGDAAEMRKLGALLKKNNVRRAPRGWGARCSARGP